MYIPLRSYNPKKQLQWLIKFLTTAPLAAPVLMSAPWKLSPKATSIKLIPMFAPTAVRVPMFAPLKQSILRKHNQVKQSQNKPVLPGRAFFIQNSKSPGIATIFAFFPATYQNFYTFD